MTLRTSFSLIVLAFMPLLFPCAFAQNSTFYKVQGYSSLFNGKDLSQWVVPEVNDNNWSVIDGVIDCDSRMPGKGDKHLWSEKKYKDFELHIEWRFKGYGDHLFKVPTILPNGDYLLDENGEKIVQWLPNADSGILLKGVGQTNLWCWPIGSGELWSVRNNKKLLPSVRAGATPSSNQDNPVGFWNAFDITVKGNHITIKNNGIIVIDNALYPGLDITGQIGLQHHGGLHAKTGKLRGASSLIQFRNIWIKEL